MLYFNEEDLIENLIMMFVSILQLLSCESGFLFHPRPAQPSPGTEQTNKMGGTGGQIPQYSLLSRFILLSANNNPGHSTI